MVRAGMQNVLGLGNVIETRQSRTRELELGMIDEDRGLSRGPWSQLECKMYWL